MNVVIIHLERSTDGGTTWGSYAGFPDGAGGVASSITIDDTGQTDWEIPPNLDPSHKWRLVSKETDGTIISTAEFDVKSKSEIKYLDEENKTLSTTKVNILNFGDQIRFACGKSDTPSIYQIIDRNYFWGKEKSSSYLINDIANALTIGSGADILVTLSDNDTTATIFFEPYLSVAGENNSTLFSNVLHPDRWVLKGIDKLYIDGVLIDEGNEQFSYSTKFLGTKNAQLILNASYGTFSGQDIQLEYSYSPIKGYDGFHYDKISYPRTSDQNDSLDFLNASVVSVEDVEGNIIIDSVGFDLANNTYYYKFVPVWDGIQESPLPDTPQFNTGGVETDESTHKRYIKIDLDVDNLNPRITSINIYRSKNYGGTYYKISTISTKGRLKDPNVIAESNTISNLGIWVANSNIALAEDPDTCICINGRLFEIKEALKDREGNKTTTYRIEALTGIEPCESQSGSVDVVNKIPDTGVEILDTSENKATGWTSFGGDQNHPISDYSTLDPGIMVKNKGVWGAKSSDSVYKFFAFTQYDQTDNEGTPPGHDATYEMGPMGGGQYFDAMMGTDTTNFPNPNTEESFAHIKQFDSLPHREGGFQWLRKSSVKFQDFLGTEGKYPANVSPPVTDALWTAGSITGATKNNQFTGGAGVTKDIFKQFAVTIGLSHIDDFDPNAYTTDPNNLSVAIQDGQTGGYSGGMFWGRATGPFQSVLFQTYHSGTGSAINTFPMGGQGDIESPLSLQHSGPSDGGGKDGGDGEWVKGTKVNESKLDTNTKCLWSVTHSMNDPSGATGSSVPCNNWTLMTFGHTMERMVDTDGDGVADHYFEPARQYIWDLYSFGGGTPSVTRDAPDSADWSQYSFLPIDDVNKALVKLEQDKTYYVGMWVRLDIGETSTDVNMGTDNVYNPNRFSISIRSYDSSGYGSIQHAEEFDYSNPVSGVTGKKWGHEGSGIHPFEFSDSFYEDDAVTGEHIKSYSPGDGHHDPSVHGYYDCWPLLDINQGVYYFRNQESQNCTNIGMNLWSSRHLQTKVDPPGFPLTPGNCGDRVWKNLSKNKSGQHTPIPDYSKKNSLTATSGEGDDAGWIYLQRKFKVRKANQLYGIVITSSGATGTSSDPASVNFVIDNITFGEAVETEPQTLYGGEYLTINPNWNLDDQHSKAGSTLIMSNTATENFEDNTQASFTTPGVLESKIEFNKGNIVRTHDKITDAEINSTTPIPVSGVVVDSVISKNYKWIHKKDETLNKWLPKLTFEDHFIANGPTHINGETSVETNYEHSKFINGRLFVANVQISSDLGSEEHNDFIMFSELGKPDVIPITNFIQIRDFEGSEILGLEELLGNLVVFVTKGIFLLQIPKDDPASWTLLETEKSIGLSATKSISKWEQFIFFAGHDNFYVLDKNFNATPISRSIKDVYMQYNNSETTSVVDIKNDRILVQLGGLKGYIYAFDLKGFANNEEKWSRLDMQGQENVSAFVTDENYSVYTFLQKTSTNYTTITDVDGLKAYETTTAGGDGTAHIIIPRTQQTNALKDYEYIKIAGVLSGYQAFTHSSYYDDTLNYIVDKYTLTDDTSFDNVFTTFDTDVNDNEMIGADVNTDAQLVDSKDTTIYNLIPTEGQTIETIKGTIKTGWIKFGDIDEKKTCRRFMIKYKASNPITAKIYIDGKSTAEKEITIPASANESMTSYRVGRSCKTIQLEVSSQNGMNQTFEIYRLELEIDE